MDLKFRVDFHGIVMLLGGRVSGMQIIERCKWVKECRVHSLYIYMYMYTRKEANGRGAT